MPGLLFSGANAALVAYGDVDGATGTVIEDGQNTTAGRVTVTKEAGLGVYTLTLPTGYGQSRTRSMVMCSPIATSGVFIGVVDAATQSKAIYTFAASGTAANVSFSFMIFENTAPLPA